ncbi:hypothetical protein ACIQ6K_35330 [Streptomyces sp. NPDC096354]|uniref:hypothetical protein n=1 Tax=Streptomyces sp. NPDC096354 TaxID=3366088 RepID=UPI0038141E33
MGKKNPRPRRSFTPDFKAEIVELCRRIGTSMRTIVSPSITTSLPVPLRAVGFVLPGGTDTAGVVIRKRLRTLRRAAISSIA